jgi:hypothetical protein
MSHNKKILLMFLGGFPSIEENINHYIQLNEIFEQKNNFHVVLHPLVLDSKINIINSNSIFLSIFNESNIYVVDENHHIPTAWASQSLVDATLLMIQYAHLNNANNLFDKYILLSPTCVPIFTFNEIYNKIILDDKSWINFIIKNYDEAKIKNPYNKYDIKINGSQWMILDKKHIKMFFINERYSDTYYVNLSSIDDTDTYICRGQIMKSIKINSNINTENEQNYGTIINSLEQEITSVNFIKNTKKLKSDEFDELRKIIKNMEIEKSIGNEFSDSLTIETYKEKKNKKKIDQMLNELIEKKSEEKKNTETIKNKVSDEIKTLDKLFNYFYEVYKKCDSPVDEIFFCSWILHNLTKNLISVKGGKKTMDTGRENSKYKQILNDNFKIINFEYCITDKNIYKCKLNKLKQTIIDNLHKVSELNKLNGTKQIKPMPRLKTDKYNINGIDIIVPQLQFSINDIINPELIVSIPSFNNYYFALSTFTDWFQTGIDPFNIFRDFSKFKIIDGIQINIKEYLNKQDSFSTIYDFLTINIEPKDGKINIYKLITSPLSHPVEYSEWNLINVINAFYLFNWLVNNSYINIANELDDTIKMLNKTFIIYKKIIFENISKLTEEDKINLNETIYLTKEKLLLIGSKIDEYISEIGMENILNKKFSTPITDSTLVSAFLCDSLFIRKSLKGSNINTFTPILKTLKINELYNETDERTLVSNANSDDLFNPNYIYMLKYYKYKEKYLNLKNYSIKN